MGAQSQSLLPRCEHPGARLERLTLLHRNSSAGGAVHALIVVAAAWAFAGAVSASVLAGWAGAMLGLTLLRWWLCRSTLRESRGVAAVERRQRAYDAVTLLTGVGWGAGAWLLFVPSDVSRQTFLVLLMCGTAMGSVATLSPNFPTLLCALLPSMPPLAARLLTGAQPMSIATGILVLLFLAVLLIVGARFERLLRSSLHMRFELARKSAQLEVDILRRTRLEADLRAARERAEAAVVAKSRFLARASHDLRQPLHAVGLFVSSLLHRVREPGAEELLGQIQGSLESMSGLFDSLLDLSRLDADAVSARPRPLALQGLLAPLVEEHRVLAQLKGLRLRAMPTGLWGHSDPVLLGRIVRNLLSNALRYTSRGGILVGCRRRGDRIAIEVWDTGVGIASDQLERVFDEFAQVQDVDHGRRSSFGLGLAIVRRLAGLLDHRVTVRSRPGRGSVFTVLVPVAAPEPVGLGTATVHPEGQDASGLLVVVVDDVLAVRQAMASLLESWGCTVVAAADVEQALEGLRGAGRGPDLILSDWELGGAVTGLDAVTRLRAAGSGAAAAIITGRPVPERALAEAGVLLLHKPAPPARLRALVGHVLAERSATREARTA